jgi:integrase
MVDKNAHYLMNKDGVFYFTRHVPNDVRHLYERPRLVMCLKTKSEAMALKASRSMASRLDDYWLQMRLTKMDVPAAHLMVKGRPKEAFTSSATTLSDALAKYCQLKGQGKPKHFFRAAERNTGYVIDLLGDRPVDTYSTADAAAFRDWLIDRGLAMSSTTRIFGTVKAIFNLTIQEDGIGCLNAFAKTYLPHEDAAKRPPIPKGELRVIQRTCLDMADERRLLIALISDTGMRLSEALGLVWADIHVGDTQHPHVNLVPHPWRKLKNSGSKRLVPLVGVSLEAIKTMHRQGVSHPFLFKSYTNKTKCNGNSASAALNKWMKGYTEQGVVHSFRHSLRDRLREADVNAEMIDEIGGWSGQSIGQRYGSGYTLKQKYKAMGKIVLTPRWAKA